MSMREYPNNGYVLPLLALMQLLSESNGNKLKYFIDEDRHVDEIEEFINSILPENVPSVEVYKPSEEDTVDDEYMEHGKYYALFSEEDLFVKTPSPAMLYLQYREIEPKHTNWSVWG